MNRDIAKRPQNVVLGVEHLDSRGASRQRARPAVRSTGSLAGRECKGCPAPHRGSETPRLTRTGRFRAVLGLGLSRLLEFVVAWNRCRRDRQLLTELNEWSLRDIGIDSTTVERISPCRTGTCAFVWDPGLLQTCEAPLGGTASRRIVLRQIVLKSLKEMVDPRSCQNRRDPLSAFPHQERVLIDASYLAGLPAGQAMAPTDLSEPRAKRAWRRVRVVT